MFVGKIVGVNMCIIYPYVILYLFVHILHVCSSAVGGNKEHTRQRLRYSKLMLAIMSHLKK